jgi:hypothetical protein
VYWSTLDKPTGLWDNRLVTFGDARDTHPMLDGVSWEVFPTQQPARLASGRLLVPVTLMAVSHPDKRASVMISDNEGASFTVSPGTTIQNRSTSQWETTVWQPTGSVNTVLMFDRTADGRGTPGNAYPLPNASINHAISTDAGSSWGWLTAVNVNTIVSRALVVPIRPPMFMMVSQRFTSLWSNSECIIALSNEFQQCSCGIILRVPAVW